MKKCLWFLSVFALSAFPQLGFGQVFKEAAFVRVIDGDTIKVIFPENPQKEENVRLMSIDTPETNAWGIHQGVVAEKAKALLASLMPTSVGSKIQLELPGETLAKSRDSYGRVLAWVYRGDKNVNVILVAAGMAVPFILYPNLQHTADFLAAADFAEKQSKAWENSFGDDVYTFYSPENLRDVFAAWNELEKGDARKMDLAAQILPYEIRALFRESRNNGGFHYITCDVTTGTTYSSDNYFEQAATQTDPAKRIFFRDEMNFEEAESECEKIYGVLSNE
jgi:micrococcal nuclease